jgi:hypothetical protein
MNKVISNPFEYLLVELKEGIIHKQEFLGNGTCKDYADYMFVAGQIRCLKEVAQFVEKMLKDMDGDDND